MPRSVKGAVVLLSCLLFLPPPFETSTIPNRGGLKNYSGLRISNDSQISVFENDQTVAIIERGKASNWLSCEIIETYTEKDKTATLSKLTNLGYTILKTPFDVMIQIMDHCNDIFPDPIEARVDENRNIPKKDPTLLTLLNGILPGTKWCGQGDIAKDYHDLGRQKNIDRCCRTHDLCPLKLRANHKMFNLTNTSFYSKSHCDCDDKLYKCLKKANHPIADLMGKIYFNVLHIPCIKETNSTKVCSTENEKQCFIPLKFMPVNKSY